MSVGRPPHVSLEEFKAKASKGEVTPEAMLYKHYVPDTIKVDGGSARRATFIISTGSVDRERDTVAVEGWDAESWLKNPVVLFAHRYDELPIARGISLVKGAGQLRATIEWPDKGVHDLADTTYEMVKGGFLKGASVGFRPKISQWNDDRRGMDFVEQELLEFSLVPVPANPEALLESAKSLAGAMAAGINVEPLERALLIAKGAMGYGKGTVPSNVSSSKAPEDAQWSKPTLGDFTDKNWDDLSDAEKRHIAGHYAWAASMPPAKFADLKLPHHDPKSGSVVWRGVAAAMGALQGARGGVSIPDVDKEKVHAHLAAHYRQFDKEPPEKDAEPPVVRSGRVFSQANKEALEEAIGHCKRAKGAHKDVGAAMDEGTESYKDAGDAIDECMRSLKAAKTEGKAAGNDPIEEAIGHLKRVKRLHKDGGEAMEEAAGHHEKGSGLIGACLNGLKALLKKAEGDADEGDNEPEIVDGEEPDEPVPDVDGDQPDAQARGQRKSTDLVEVDLGSLMAEAVEKAATAAVGEKMRRATGRLD